MPIEDFEKNWKVNWPKGTIECHSPNEAVEYTVTDFWRWIRKEEASENGVVFPRVIDTDGMGSSYGLPRKVRLTKAYTIDVQSLKHLIGTDSTLLDASNNVLVPDSLRNGRWWESNIVQGAIIFLAFLGIVVAFL